MNHKRVYRVMRDEGLLVFRKGQRPVSKRRHEGVVAARDTSNADALMDWNLFVIMVNAFALPLH